MSFELSQIALICLAYLLLVFGIAWATERGRIGEKIINHPITFVLSLGIFASAWAYYGVIDLAFQFGYGALAYYLGTGALFLFAPLALAPLAELTRRYQVRSLPDLLVFRYHSHGAGVLATLCMLLGILPLLALQLQAVGDTLLILTRDSREALSLEGTGFLYKEVMALAYCAILAAFTILFGSKRDQHRGLIVAMAFESLIKVVALVAVGLLAIYGVFGGFEEIDLWLQDHPENLQLLHSPIKDTASHTLLLVFIATALSMPHLFQMGMAENSMAKMTSTLTWAFPLFLLLMALPIFPILWAGFALDVPLPAQYFTLGVPMFADSKAITILAFIGGLSAATGAMVVIILALTTMIMNHWLLPVFNPAGKHDFYHQLTWMRKILIATIFFGAYIFYRLLGQQYSLTNLALIAFIETLQFLPGIFAITFWPKANRRGLITGLIAGTSVWVIGLLLPTLFNFRSIPLPGLEFGLPVGVEHWNNITLISLLLNSACFVTMSLLFQQTKEEEYSADLCADDELSHPLRQALDVHSVAEFKQRLTTPLGKTTADKEVDMALEALNLAATERRPYALRRLRDQIEANLSGLMGIHLASEIIDECIPYTVAEVQGSVDINLMENRLTQFRTHLTGMAAELNNLRLYHRQTLQELPMAVCSLGRDLEILMWNRAMSELTSIPSEEITGSHLDSLPEPWSELLGNFSAGDSQHLSRQPITLNSKNHWISLHKASIEGDLNQGTQDQVIMLEDVTELQLLEQELVHSERLASVGRLAAGVAHEIGNPVTGIACLAQNLRYDSENPEVLETADMIIGQTDRIGRIVQTLVSFSHSGQNRVDISEPVNLHTCAQEAVSLLSLQKEKTYVHYHNDIPDHLNIIGDSQKMIQVFVNLLANARDASPEEGNITLEGSLVDMDVIVTVTDEGTGIEPELLDQILEPFFTTKEPGEGTGLGLPMVYSIVEDHGGHIKVESPADISLGRGAKFIIKLPSALESEAQSGTVVTD